MPSEPTDDTPSIQIANQIINVANSRMQDGLSADVVAQGLRHAAANFSAFVEHRKEDCDPRAVFEEFAQLLEYYLNRHSTPDNQSPSPAAGLNQLIKQAKDEL